MTFIKQYYENTVKQDFLNRYNFKHVTKIPKFSKIVISFNFVNYSKKKVLSCLLSILILTNTKSKLIKSKTHNLKLKIKKGAPVSCIVVLRKKSLYLFLENFIYNYLPKMNKNNFVLKHNNFFSIRIPKSLLINEFNNFYSFFKDMLDLNVTFVANSNRCFMDIWF